MLINVRVTLEYWQHNCCTISDKRSQERVRNLDHVDAKSWQGESLHVGEDLFALINNIHLVKRVNVLVGAFHGGVETGDAANLLI